MANSPWGSCPSDQGYSVAEKARRAVIDSAIPIIKSGGTDDLADHLWGVLVGFASLCLNRRRRHLERYPHKWSLEKEDQLYSLLSENWRRMRAWFRRGEGQPDGLSGFVREMGWGEP